MTSVGFSVACCQLKYLDLPVYQGKKPDHRRPMHASMILGLQVWTGARLIKQCNKGGKPSPTQQPLSAKPHRADSDACATSPSKHIVRKEATLHTMDIVVMPTFPTGLMIQLRAREPHSLDSLKGFLIPEFTFQWYHHNVDELQCSGHRHALLRGYFKHTHTHAASTCRPSCSHAGLRHGLSLKGLSLCRFPFVHKKVHVMCVWYYLLSLHVLMHDRSPRRSSYAIICIVLLDDHVTHGICSC